SADLVSDPTAAITAIPTAATDEHRGPADSSSPQIEVMEPAERLRGGAADEFDSENFDSDDEFDSEDFYSDSDTDSDDRDSDEGDVSDTESEGSESDREDVDRRASVASGSDDALVRAPRS